MVETGTYFSTGSKCEGTDAESESPGSLRRGLRSTSYRRAVVSGIDTQGPNDHPLFQPGIRMLDGISAASAVSAQSESPSSPGTPKLGSPGTPKLGSPGIIKPTSPSVPKPASPGNMKVSKPTRAVRWYRLSAYVMIYSTYKTHESAEDSYRVLKKRLLCDALIPFILKAPVSSPSELWNEVFFLWVPQFGYGDNNQPGGFIFDVA